MALSIVDVAICYNPSSIHTCVLHMAIAKSIRAAGILAVSPSSASWLSKVWEIKQAETIGGGNGREISSINAGDGLIASPIIVVE